MEIVELEIAPEHRERLVELRNQILIDYGRAYPDLSASLCETEDGRWIDTWSWNDRKQAEHALANPEPSPSYAEFQTMVKLLSLTWATPVR